MLLSDFAFQYLSPLPFADRDLAFEDDIELVAYFPLSHYNLIGFVRLQVHRPAQVFQLLCVPELDQKFVLLHHKIYVKGLYWPYLPQLSTQSALFHPLIFLLDLS